MACKAGSSGHSETPCEGPRQIMQVFVLQVGQTAVCWVVWTEAWGIQALQVGDEQ